MVAEIPWHTGWRYGSAHACVRPIHPQLFDGIFGIHSGQEIPTLKIYKLPHTFICIRVIADNCRAWLLWLVTRVGALR